MKNREKNLNLWKLQMLLIWKAKRSKWKPDTEERKLSYKTQATRQSKFFRKGILFGAGDTLFRIFRRRVYQGAQKRIGRYQVSLRLPYFDDFQRFDLSSEMQLTAISQRIHAAFPKPSRVKPKSNLFNMRIRKQLFKPIRENATNDKRWEFGQERLFRRSGTLPISETFDELVELDF